MIATALAVGFFSSRRTGWRAEPGALFAVALRAHQEAESQLEASRYEDAEQACLQALLALDELVVRSPGERRYRQTRAAVLQSLGQSYVALGNADLAAPAFKDAIDVWSKLLAEVPSDLDIRSRLATCLGRLGTAYCDAGRWDEAESTLNRGRLLCEKLPTTLVDDPRVTRDRVGFLEELGRLLLETGRLAEALECDNIAVTTQRALTRAPAATSDDRERLVKLLMKLAAVYTGLGRPADNERVLAEASDVADLLRAESPAQARHDELAATVLDLRANTIKSDPDRAALAQQLFGRALAIRERLVAGAPRIPEYLAKLAATCDSIARLYHDQGAFDQAEAFYRKALSYQGRLTSEHPDVTAYRFDHGRLLHNLADLLRGRDRVDLAVALATRAVEQLGSVYRETLNNGEYRTAFSYASWTLCALLLDCKEERAAAKAIADYLKIEPRGYEEPLEGARFLCRCAQLRRPDSTPRGPQLGPTAQTYADQAMSALVIAVRNGFRDLEDLETSATFDPLRGRDDFQRLLREVESKMAVEGRG
jgi:tetratricopeptide (TPR) repeat protein